MSTPIESTRDAWRAFAGPSGWRSIVWPSLFALAALALLVYDHLHQRVTHLVFWLGLGLIACVFAWLVETTRRQSGALSAERLRATRDGATGLLNRGELQARLTSILTQPGERWLFVMVDMDGLRAYSDGFGSAAADELAAQLAGSLSAAVEPFDGIPFRIDATRFAVLLPTAGRELGEMLFAATNFSFGEHSVGCSFGDIIVPDEAGSVEVAFQIAAQRLASSQRHSARRQAHAVLMAVLDARRPELRAHLRSVAFRAISLSRRLGIDRDEIDDIVLAAELQDIGLLTVPESILEKDSPLAPAESALIRNHPLAGERIVASAPELAPVSTLVRAASERFDGHGYPDGVAGEAIPLGARIIAVCVAFAAMTSNRPYQESRGAAEALAEIERNSGSQFDPAVVEALVDELAEETADFRQSAVVAHAYR